MTSEVNEVVGKILIQIILMKLDFHKRFSSCIKKMYPEVNEIWFCLDENIN